MAPPDPRRRLFPQDRAAYMYQGPMKALLQPPQMSIVIYSNEQGTALADIVTGNDVSIEDSIIVLGADGLMPEFFGPIGADTLWARPLGLTNTPYPLYPVVKSVPAMLRDLGDVADVDPVDGQTLVWDEDILQYRPGTLAGDGPAGTKQHIQETPATVWGPIAHNIGERPAAVSLFSLDFTQQYDGFAVEHLSTNTLRISMDVATAGVALIS